MEVDTKLVQPWRTQLATHQVHRWSDVLLRREALTGLFGVAVFCFFPLHDNRETGLPGLICMGSYDLPVCARDESPQGLVILLCRPVTL